MLDSIYHNVLSILLHGVISLPDATSFFNSLCTIGSGGSRGG